MKYTRFLIFWCLLNSSGFALICEKSFNTAPLIVALIESLKTLDSRRSESLKIINTLSQADFPQLWEEASDRERFSIAILLWRNSQLMSLGDPYTHSIPKLTPYFEDLNRRNPKQLDRFIDTWAKAEQLSERRISLEDFLGYLNK